jgi:hypothetical protein
MHGRGRRLRTTRGKMLTSIAVALALAVAALAGGVVANASGSAPTAVTEPTNPVGFTTATLKGTVNANGGEVTQCEFRYGTTPSLGHSVSCSFLPGHGVTPVTVEANVAGLSESQIYHVALFAKNANGESLAEERQFTTLPTTPHSNTNAAHNVTHTSGLLTGAVDPDGALVTECYFEYGSEPSSLSSHAPCEQSPGSGTEPVPVSAQLSGLPESDSVYFRLVSKNSFGSDGGLKEHFFTPPNQPNANDEVLNEVGRTTATLRGLVDPRDSLVESCYFEWGSVSVSEHTTPCETLPGGGEGFVNVSAKITGLTESTTYFWRTVATNAFGENVSGQRNFTTEPTLPRDRLQATNEVAARSALLKGVINPEDTTIIECTFEYGTTPALLQSAPCNLLPSGEGFQKVQSRITGLTPSTKYFYRLAATNSFGTEYSGEQNITTFEPGLLPVITKLTPKKGDVTGGNSVVIKGSNLGEVTSVSFGGVESEKVTVDGVGEVTAVAPPGAGVVDVTATSIDGTSEITPNDHYTYGKAVISSVSPGSGPIAGGTEVTVTGAGFLPGAGQTTFLFNKSMATSVSCSSNDTCTMITPAEPKGKAKTVKVNAVTLGKKSPNSPGAVFTYTP